MITDCRYPRQKLIATKDNDDLKVMFHDDHVDIFDGAYQSLTVELEQAKDMITVLSEWVREVEKKPAGDEK